MYIIFISNAIKVATKFCLTQICTLMLLTSERYVY